MNTSHDKTRLHKTPSHKTLGIGTDTHAQLKAISKQKGISMSRWLEKVVDYFYRMGINVDDLGAKGENRLLTLLKKDVSTLIKIIRTQEKSILEPLAHSVFAMESRLLGTGIWVEITCPKCQAPSENFTWKEDYLHCNLCGFKLPLQVGEKLEMADILCLLAGGITRHFGTLITPQGQQVQGRLFLDTAQNYALTIYHEQ